MHIQTFNNKSSKSILLNYADSFSASICAICGKKSPADLADFRGLISAFICAICGKKNLPQIPQISRIFADLFLRLSAPSAGKKVSRRSR